MSQSQSTPAKSSFNPILQSRSNHSIHSSSQTVTSTDEVNVIVLDTTGYAPNIAIAENDVMYATVCTYGGIHAHNSWLKIYKSVDFGQSWNLLCTTNAPNGNIVGTPAVEISNGRNTLLVALAINDTTNNSTSVMIAHWDTSGNYVNATTIYSHNTTIIPSVSICSNKLERSGDEIEFYLSLTAHDSLLYSRTTDSGNSWSALEFVTNGVINSSRSKSIAVTNGRILLSTIYSAWPGGVYVASKNIVASSWSIFRVIYNSDGTAQSSSIGAKSGVVAVASEYTSASYSQVLCAVSSNNGNSWQTPEPFSSSTDPYWKPSLAIGSTGKLALTAYFRAINSSISSWHSTDNGSSWVNNGTLSQGNGVSSTNHSFLETVINSRNQVAAIWSGTTSSTNFVIEPPHISTDPVILIAPSSNEINTPIIPLFSWRAMISALNYRLQLSTSSNFTNLIINQANLTDTCYTGTTLNNSTTYYWRVRAVNSTDSSGWTSDHFTTLPIGFPSPPILISPANGATNILNWPTLSWNTVANAQNYQLQISTESDFLYLPYDVTGLTQTHYDVSWLLYSLTYYWRVRATNSAGTSNWSIVYQFTTNAETTPNPPELVSPEDGSISVLLSPTLSWNRIYNASTYYLQLSSSPDFSSILINSNYINNNSYTCSSITLANSTTYYWRVLARNHIGLSNWSNTFHFTTVSVTVPNPPTLVTPTNGATDVSLEPTLSWSVIPTADTCQLQIATSSSFDLNVRNYTNLRSNNVTCSNLSYSTTYYWHVRERNRVGYSNWSEAFYFTTISETLPVVPILTLPSNGASNVAINPTQFSWQAATNANYYRIKVDDDPQFWSPVINDTTSHLTFSTRLLQSNTNYYWNVCGANASGEGQYSATNHFITSVDGIAEQTDELPTVFFVHDPYPNPFNPETTIRFNLPVQSAVKIEVYDVTGRLISTLLQGYLSAGSHSIRWNGADHLSGIYWLSFHAGKNHAVRKLILMK